MNSTTRNNLVSNNFTNSCRIVSQRSCFANSDYQDDLIVNKTEDKIIVKKNSKGALCYDPATIFEQPRSNLKELLSKQPVEGNTSMLQKEETYESAFIASCRKAPLLINNGYSIDDMSSIIRKKALGEIGSPSYEEFIDFFEKFTLKNDVIKNECR